MNAPTKLSLVDFFNGTAVAVLVPEGSTESLSLTTAKHNKQDFIELISRRFQNAIEVASDEIVVGLSEGGDHNITAILLIPSEGSMEAVRNGSSDLCSRGQDAIKASKRIRIERKLAALDAQRAELTAQLDG